MARGPEVLGLFFPKTTRVVEVPGTFEPYGGLSPPKQRTFTVAMHFSVLFLCSFFGKKGPLAQAMFLSKKLSSISGEHAGDMRKNIEST